jgi:tetratricopeptide (TPR) repeat protein
MMLFFRIVQRYNRPEWLKMARDSNRLLLLTALTAMMAITVATYYPGMSAGFYFDDRSNFLWVTEMQWLHFDFETLQRTLSNVNLPSRPVANISIAFTYLLSGFDPAPYHWTNLVIHLAAGLALFWVIRLFQLHHTSEKGGTWLALVLVFLFLVHPLNIQAVTYVIQRMTSMSALFILLGLGCYLSGRYNAYLKKRVIWFSLTVLCLLLSIGSKEIGYLLLPLLLLFEICFHSSDWRSKYKTMTSQVSRRILAASAGVLIVLVVSAAWYVLSDRVYWLETFPNRDFSGYERVLTQGRVQVFYLSLLLWPSPSRLNLDHEFLLSRSMFDPITTALALAGWLTVILFALRNATTRPRLTFPILAYLLLHSIESAPISLELVFEHRMYLPMTMIALLLALNIGPLTEKYLHASYATLLATGLLLATATYARNEVWGDPLTFHRDCSIKSPNKWRPQYNLGTELGQRGLYKEAKIAFEKAISIKPDDSESHNQLGNVYMVENQQHVAERHYRLAIENNAENAEAYYNLSVLLSQQQRYEEQREMLEQFIEKAPPHLEKQKQWAIRYLKQ